MSEGCRGGGGIGVDSFALLSEEHVVGFLGAGGDSEDLLIEILDPVVDDVYVSRRGIGNGFDGFDLSEELSGGRDVHRTLSNEIFRSVQGHVGVGGVDTAHLVDLFDDEV